MYEEEEGYPGWVWTSEFSRPRADAPSPACRGLLWMMLLATLTRYAAATSSQGKGEHRPTDVKSWD